MIIDVVILAAGMGTRMYSDLPKPLHRLMGKPIINYIIAAAESLANNPPVIVIGHKKEQFKDLLGDNYRYVEQKELLGTGHAVSQADSLLNGNSDLVLVVSGDMPLVKTQTLRSLIDTQISNTGPITILTLLEENPRGFGRVVRDKTGQVLAIVEEADASSDQLLINEFNGAMYCFRGDWLWKALKEIKLSPKGEYYLTDLVEMAGNEGLKVEAVQVDDKEELIGINNRVHLADTGRILQQRINREMMLSGVTIIDPESTYIEMGVIIGQDTVLLPNTYLQGDTILGNKCQIGPNTKIYNSQIGDSCEIEFSVIEESRIEDDVDIGPFSHLRKGAHLGTGVHVGNFGEIKDSYLGEGTKMGHFSYIGDAQIGKDVNIGAGTITCNYDGEKKHQTTIKDGVFIGSDSMLVAPLEIGEDSVTGAGSVVTKDVPPDTVVVGVPARQIAKRKKKK